jgi:hypothetical protein
MLRIQPERKLPNSLVWDVIQFANNHAIDKQNVEDFVLDCINRYRRDLIPEIEAEVRNDFNQ